MSLPDDEDDLDNFETEAEAVIEMECPFCDGDGMIYGTLDGHRIGMVCLECGGAGFY